jgi:maleate isomerase
MTEDVKRVGLLIPSPGVVTRDEFSRLFAGANTVFHEVAPPSQPETEGWQLPRFELEEAVRALVAKKVDVIVHAGVLPSVSLGIERESQISDVISSVTDVPHVVAMQATLMGLRHLRARTVSIISPLGEVIGERIRSYFSAHEISILDIAGLGEESAHGVHAITEADVWKLVQQSADVEAPADCLYIFGGGLRSLNILDSIERFTRRPAVSSNGATAWAVRRLIGLPVAVPGCGSLLA